MSPTPARLALLIGAAALLVAACADEEETASVGGADGDAVPAVVVTTNILGDMVREVVGDAAEVEVVMPLGTDPHDFEVSAQQAESMVDADFLVVNGAGFEETLLGTIESAEEAGVATFAFADNVTLRPFVEPEGAHEGEEEGEHAEEEEGDEE
ncbi:MAG: zinc ABC transporter substrate-binding protein, partial [Acidimicrobiales bacterium]